MKRKYIKTLKKNSSTHNKTNEFSENLCVYETLRNEIISTQAMRKNIIMYMYAVYATLFVLAVEFSYYFFLLTYIILIPFQAQIFRCKFTISKISAYIKIFFEDEREDMHWESLQVSQITKPFLNKTNNRLVSLLAGTGSVQLGILSTISFISYILYNSYNNNAFNLQLIELLLIFISIVLVFVIIIVNNEYKKNYNAEIYEAFAKYKENIKNKTK